MSAKNQDSAVRPTDVTLRSYNVGFGDCFLLSFHYPSFDRHVLIDFGSTRAPEGKNLGAHMLAVARRTQTDCAGKLHAVVVTHRHKDHLSGFAYQEGEGPGAIIRALKPDVVVQPWTEDPRAERDATKPTASLSSRRQRVAQHVASLADMNRFAGYVRQVSGRLKGTHLKSVRDQLEFLGDDNELANRDAVTNLMEMGRRKRYVYFGARSGLESVLPGVTTHVLGPPTLEQTRSILKQRNSDSDQFWHIAEERAGFWAQRSQIAAADHQEQTPLFPRHVEKRMPWDMRWYRYHAQKEQAENLLSIVRSLDDQMNNTSVILLFEAGGKSLLFPGDAQYENWMYALSQPGIQERLARVDLYKVGHHGSLNATPKDLWNGFTAKGTKTKQGRLQSFLSTRDGVHGKEDHGTEVPRTTLVKALMKDSHLHDTRSLGQAELAIVKELKL